MWLAGPDRPCRPPGSGVTARRTAWRREGRRCLRSRRWAAGPRRSRARRAVRPRRRRRAARPRRSAPPIPRHRPTRAPVSADGGSGGGASPRGCSAGRAGTATVRGWGRARGDVSMRPRVRSPPVPRIPPYAGSSSASPAPAPRSGRSPSCCRCTRSSKAAPRPSDWSRCCGCSRRPCWRRSRRRSRTGGDATSCSRWSRSPAARPRPGSPCWSPRTDRRSPCTRSRSRRRLPRSSTVRSTPRCCPCSATRRRSSRRPTSYAGSSTRSPRSSARASPAACWPPPTLTSGFAAVAVLAGLSAAVTIGLTVEEPESRVSRHARSPAVSCAAPRSSFRSPQLRVLFVLLAAQTLTRGALSVFSVLVAVDLLGMGEPGVGTLTAAVGAGAVLGSLFALMYVGNRRLGGLVRRRRRHLGTPPRPARYRPRAGRRRSGVVRR